MRALRLRDHKKTQLEWRSPSSKAFIKYRKLVYG